MADRGPEITLRPAQETDCEAVAALVYASAGGMYDRYAGGKERALRLLRRAFPRPGYNASAEVVTLAEVEGEAAGAVAAFPAEEIAGRAAAILRLTLRSVPPWRWPGALRLYWMGMRTTPGPPPGALYVDALATARPFRRRGVARALLRHVEENARSLGLTEVALDTSLDNRPARSLYLSEGFEEVAYRPPGRGMPGFVALVKRVG